MKVRQRQIGNRKGVGLSVWSSDAGLSGFDLSLGRRTTLSGLHRRRGTRPVVIDRKVRLEV